MRPKIDILPSCVMAMDLSNGYMNTTGVKKVFDHSQYHNHGTVVGALPRYPGFLFDGINDYVDCGNDASLNITDEMTIEAWVKRNGDGSGSYPGIVAKYNSNGGYMIYYNPSTNKTTFYLRKDASTSVFVNSDGTLPLNTWTHIVGVYGTDDVLRMYINGIEQTDTKSWTNIFSSTDNLIIGEVDSNHFNGTIDEVRIFSKALSALQVKNHFELSRWRYN